MKCDELNYKMIRVEGKVIGVCLATEVDEAIAELKAENEKLNNALDKERSETIKYMDELCNAKNEIERLTIDKRNAELRADVADATVEKLKAENVQLKQKLQDQCISCPVKMQEDDVVADLKQKLEDAKATAYTESVDAGMRERRMKRALWLVRAKKAESEARGWYQSNSYIINYDGLHNIKGVLYGKGFKRYPKEWMKLWIKIERLCLAKAEEYK